MNEKRSLMAAALTLFIILCGSAHPLFGQQSAEMNESSLAFHTDIFSVTDVDIKDANAAVSMLANSIAKDVGIKLDHRLYDDLDSIKRDFKNGKIDVLSIPALDYLKMENELNAENFLVTLRNGSKYQKYLILTNQAADVGNIGELKSKRLAVLRNDRIAMLFLDTLLLKNGHSEANGFFSNIEEKKKYSNILTDLFFGKVDCGIVSEASFKTMSELNPQFENRLNVIATSPGYVISVGLFRKNFDPAKKKKYRDASFNLGNTIQGRQVLLLFKIDKNVPLVESDYDTLRALVKEHDELTKRL